MFKYIKFFSELMTKRVKSPLGRWNIDYCDIKTNNKIDLSNEDHCGPCGQYIITKTNSQNKNIVCDDNKSKNKKQ
jgi:hypothetical protein